MADIVSLDYIANQHCLNSYDFDLCLKTGKLREGSLKSSGSLFQRADPEVAKLRGPIVFVWYDCMVCCPNPPQAHFYGLKLNKTMIQKQIGNYG